MTSPVPRPTAAEQLLNLLVGEMESASGLPHAMGHGVARAIEDAMLPALTREPCVVSFSGGRDSSAVLALATSAARRHGYALPIPVILRFPGAPETDETAFQDVVLRHLGLRDRAEVIDATSDLDALGPTATGVLRRHGVLWPANAYMHRPIFARAQGGALLTGAGGDELFDGVSERVGWRRRAVQHLPVRVRAQLWLRRRSPDGYDWLTGAGRRHALRALAADQARWPPDWGSSLRFWVRSRSYAGLTGALRLIGADDDVQVVHPLLELPVLAELAARGGFSSRRAAMNELCGELLPAEVVARRSKAHFATPLWGPQTRAFVAGWDGAGVDGRWADADRLRAEWTKEMPDFRTILLLQRTWLSAYVAPST